MKMNYWLILGMTLSTSLLAQQVTNSPPPAPIETPVAAPAMTGAPAPAPATTNAPAAKAAKKKSAKKKSDKKAVAKKAPVSQLKTVPLVAGPAVVIASNVNVRGQARLKGEVVTRVTKEQSVVVIEEITRNSSGPDEPSAWAKILLPANVHVWANSSFIDPTNKVVAVKKLNVRSGPGENYSVLGLLHRGDPVTSIEAKGDWTKIEAPTNAYAFVAAQYLKQEAPAPMPSPAVPGEPAPTPVLVPEASAVAAAPSETLPVTAPTEMPILTNNAPVAPVVEEPLPKRIVSHEGFVRGMTSIQAPSRFVLVSPGDGQLIDYLHTTSPNLDLRRYKGMHIIVTGEEGLDDRWGNTPVIEIQKIQVLE